MKSSGNEIAKILDTIQGFDTYTVISDFFAMSAIAVRNNVDFGREWQAYEDHYKAIVKKYNKNDLQAFVRALAVFQGWIGQAIDGQIEFRDFAGELYMDSGTSNGKAGQFFTPFSVSSVMAEVDLDTDRMKKELEEDPDKVITIYEPTCGAGGIIVAAIDKLRRANINYSWNVFVDCGDIDPRCVHMTYLTLSLLGVPAVVRRGDALALDYSETWFTPAYLFAWPHFKSRLRGGRYPYTPTVQEKQATTENKTEVRAKEKKPEAAIPETVQATIREPVADMYGQLSLF